jgi:hypothetical protein
VGKARTTYKLKKIETEEEEDGTGGYMFLEVNASGREQAQTSLLDRHVFWRAHAAEDGTAGRVAAPSNVSAETQSVDRGAIRDPGTRNGDESDDSDDSGVADFHVIYFERSADQGRVRAALSQLDIPYAVQKSSSGAASNAVWLGVDIPSEVAKRIGVALLDGGVDLRYFGYFTYTESKTNIIQIGYSKFNANNQSVSEKYIIDFGEKIDEYQAISNEKQELISNISSTVQKEIVKRQEKQTGINSDAQKGMFSVAAINSTFKNDVIMEINRIKNVNNVKLHELAPIYICRNEKMNQFLLVVGGPVEFSRARALRDEMINAGFRADSYVFRASIVEGGNFSDRCELQVIEATK